MRQLRLNLKDLRLNCIHRTPFLVTQLENLIDSGIRARVTRRTMLKMLGSALPVPAAVAAQNQAYQTFQISNERGRIAFIVGGIERWTIDPSMFEGAAKTALRRTRDQIEVTLTDAVYPGTDIAADLTCELSKASGDWLMKLQASFGQYQTSCQFLHWLQGIAVATGKLNLAATIAADKHVFKTKFAGNAVGQFHPGWHWLLEGTGIGNFDYAGESLKSDRILLTLPWTKDASLFAAKPAKRTIVSFDRGSYSWPLRPSVLSGSETLGDRWSLTVPRDLFDRITIETSEESTRQISSAFVADAPARFTAAEFQPSDDLLSDDGSPFVMSLENPRLAVAHTPDGLETAFLADYPTGNVRAHGPAYTVTLGTATDTPPFEVVSVDEKVEKVEFNPDLLSVEAPVQGAITEPCLPPPEIQDIDLPASEHSSRQWWRVAFWPPNWGKGAKCLKMGALPPVKVVRPEDLLVLEFGFENFVLEKGKDGIPRIMVPKESVAPGIVKIRFQPQSISEQAFFEASPKLPMKKGVVCLPPKDEALNEPCDPDAEKSSETPTDPPVAARMAGVSQLIFELSAGQFLDYTIEGLLDWSKLKPVLVSYADQQPAVFQSSDIRDPRASGVNPRDFTALETPYRLFLSPNKYGAWKHTATPTATSGNRVELWHTRLGLRLPTANSERSDDVDEKTTEGRTVRAIWSPDYQPSADPKKPCLLPNDNDPFRMALSRCDRHEIVRLTSDFVLDQIDTCKAENPHKPPQVRPVQVNQLMLSSLGSFMNTRGAWDPPKGVLRVEEWVHRSTMARDHYVKVVYKGYLFPLGHRASLIKVTERKFEYDAEKKDYVAYLRQRMFIVVRERVKHYPALGQPFGGRRMPFQRIEFTERDSVTPDLDEPVPINGEDIFYNFWPAIHRACYNFKFIGWDEQGPKHITAPLIFVDNIVAHDSDRLKPIFVEYLNIDPTVGPCTAPAGPAPVPNQATCRGATRKIDVNGDVIAFGPARKSGDTGLPTDHFILTVDSPVFDDALREAFKCADQPPFYPAVEFAAVHIKAVEEFTGKIEVRDVQYPLAYLRNGFDLTTNAAEIFAELVPACDLGGGTNRDPLYLNFGAPPETTAIAAVVYRHQIRGSSAYRDG